METFIIHVEKLIEEEHPSVEFIEHPRQLIDSLKELNNLVGMTSFKKQIIQLLQFAIVNNYNRAFREQNQKNLFDDHMIHMVLSGAPGCGKTTAAQYICKIIASLGILKKHEEVSEEDISLEDVDTMKSIVTVLNQFIECKENEDESDDESDDESEYSEENCEKIQEDLELERRKRNKITESVKKVVKELKGLEYTMTKTLDRIEEFYNISSRDKSELDRKRCKIRKIQETLHKTISSDSEDESEQEESKEVQIPLFVYKRSDLVGEYLGETAPKTLNALKKALGGVVLIDEAYSLINGGKSDDPYGMECLTTIIEVMSQYPHSIVIIFAGYKDSLEDTIFRAQPGLRRRIGWVFDLDKYSASDLYQIFKIQISRFPGWKVSDDPEIEKFFIKNEKSFPNFGGDTEKLALYSKNECYSSLFNKIIEGSNGELEQIITLSVLEKSLKLLNNKTNKEVPFMYI